MADATTKVAWPFDPAAVQAKVDPTLAGDIGRGVGLGHAVADAGRAVPRVLSHAGSLINHLLRPADPVSQKVLLAPVRGLTNFAKSHPTLAVGTALAAPILGGAFTASQNSQEDALMNLRQDPERDVTASEKTAGPSGLMSGSAMGGKLQDSFVGGIGSGLAQSALGGIGSLLGNGLSAIRDSFLTDRARKKVFEAVIASDIVISDKVAQNPAALEVLKEAYGTLCRFAPSLALDVNAVRSFLREAVVGGSGVNYATIKNLVETEKAMHYKTSSEKIPASVKEAVERFGFHALAAKVYGVEEINEKTAAAILGQKLAMRRLTHRTINDGLTALAEVTA